MFAQQPALRMLNLGRVPADRSAIHTSSQEVQAGWKVAEVLGRVSAAALVSSKMRPPNYFWARARRQLAASWWQLDGKDNGRSRDARFRNDSDQ